MNTIFENSGGTYAQKNGYLYPNITMPGEDKTPIGKYGRMRKRYLEEHRPIVYSQLFVSGKLFSHLQEIDRCCCERIELIVTQMAKKEGITEKLKAANQMEWIRRMNGVLNRAEEIVLNELIYN